MRVCRLEISICPENYLGKEDLVVPENRDVRAKSQKQQHLGTM